MLLAVRNLKVAYGGIQAVKGVTLEVRDGELVSLIGANGAGKTTSAQGGDRPAACGRRRPSNTWVKQHPRTRAPGIWPAKVW